MSQFAINMLFVGASFVLYIGIALWARAGSTKEFYVAGGGVGPIPNGMATAADWMSAASFISMAGLISVGYVNSSFLMGWTGGYVLLAMLLAPYLRKFGKFTVPDFVGDRFYSKGARLVAVVALLLTSITYVIGQMSGAGVAFARFLEVSSDAGIWIASAVVFVYAVPVLTALFSNVLLHEALRASQLIGGAGVIAGLWLTVRAAVPPREASATVAKTPTPLGRATV